MTHLEHEEEAILAVLERLERENRAARQDAGPAAELERRYADALGLLPFALEPVAPSPAVKARLLEAVRAEAVAVVPFAQAASDRSSPADPVRRARFGQLAAAAMAVLALGLAGASGYLYATLQQERTSIVALEAALAKRQESETEVASFRQQVEALRADFSLVTMPGVEICHLEPRDAEPQQPEALGHLYVAPNRRQWLLTAQGLDPCRGEQAYHVWFVTEEGAVSGGFFHVAAGQRIQVGSEDMPAGIRAVLVTLEASETTLEPSGPTVLYGEEPEMML